MVKEIHAWASKDEAARATEELKALRSTLAADEASFAERVQARANQYAEDAQLAAQESLPEYRLRMQRNQNSLRVRVERLTLTLRAEQEVLSELERVQAERGADAPPVVLGSVTMSLSPGFACPTVGTRGFEMDKLCI